MSKRDELALPKGQEEQELDSVFDFLYHDSRRIGSFLSQLDTDGLLTGIKQGESATRGSRRGYKVELGGDVPLLGGANVGFERGPGESGTENLERTYDPFWANARELLDYLSQHDLIERDIGQANIGQFVLATGYLSIQDLGMFKDAWKLPAIQRKMKGNASTGKKVANMTAVQKAEVREQQENTNMFIDLIQLMPHSVHARMFTTKTEPSRMVWCSLNQEY